MDGIWMVYGWCMDGVWMVYGWCMDGVGEFVMVLVDMEIVVHAGGDVGIV